MAPEASKLTPESIKLALELSVIFSATVILLAICFTFTAYIAFRNTTRGGGKTLSLMFRRAGVLQILTVVIITISIVILRILGLIASEATVSGLTGIAGFVLGGLPKTQGRSDPDAEED